MFGKRSISKDHEGVLKEIEGGERRKPEHDRPLSLAETGFKSFITPAHEVLFSDFDWFGPTLNWHVRGPWCVEEMRDTLLRDGDSPDLGRRYKIYYHRLPMGTLEIGLGIESFSLDTSAERFRSNRSARAALELNYLRFVPYQHAHNLLSQIEWLFGRVETPIEAESVQSARIEAGSRATAALTAYLWEAFRNQDGFVPLFEHATEGPYVLFRNTVDHWKSGGLNAFTLEERRDED